jgi:hypothetical protein
VDNAYFINQNGEVVQAPMQQGLENGWRLASSETVKQSEYETTPSILAGLAERAASTASFGASTWAEKQVFDPEGIKRREAAVEKHAPISGYAADMGGILASSLLLPGGGLTGLVEKGAAGVGEAATRAITGGAARTALQGYAGSAARYAARGAVEGAAYTGGSLVHEAALGDPSDVAEHALASLGQGAVLGAGISSALGLVGGASQSVLRKASDWLGRASPAGEGAAGDIAKAAEAMVEVPRIGGDQIAAARAAAEESRSIYAEAVQTAKDAKIALQSERDTAKAALANDTLEQAFKKEAEAKATHEAALQRLTDAATPAAQKPVMVPQPVADAMLILEKRYGSWAAMAVQNASPEMQSWFAANSNRIAGHPNPSAFIDFAASLKSPKNASYVLDAAVAGLEGKSEKVTLDAAMKHVKEVDDLAHEMRNIDAGHLPISAGGLTVGKPTVPIVAAFKDAVDGLRTSLDKFGASDVLPGGREIHTPYGAQARAIQEKVLVPLEAAQARMSRALGIPAETPPHAPLSSNGLIERMQGLVNKNVGLTPIAKLVDAMEAEGLDRASIHSALLDAAKAGDIELQPGSGVGGRVLRGEAASKLPPGPQGTFLEYGRPLRELPTPEVMKSGEHPNPIAFDALYKAQRDLKKVIPEMGSDAYQLAAPLYDEMLKNLAPGVRELVGNKELFGAGAVVQQKWAGNYAQLADAIARFRQEFMVEKPVEYGKKGLVKESSIEKIGTLFNKPNDYASTFNKVRALDEMEAALKEYIPAFQERMATVQESAAGLDKAHLDELIGKTNQLPKDLLENLGGLTLSHETAKAAEMAKALLNVNSKVQMEEARAAAAQMKKAEAAARIDALLKERIAMQEAAAERASMRATSAREGVEFKQATAAPVDEAASTARTASSVADKARMAMKEPAEELRRLERELAVAQNDLKSATTEVAGVENARALRTAFPQMAVLGESMRIPILPRAVRGVAALAKLVNLVSAGDAFKTRLYSAAQAGKGAVESAANNTLAGKLAPAARAAYVTSSNYADAVKQHEADRKKLQMDPKQMLDAASQAIEGGVPHAPQVSNAMQKVILDGQNYLITHLPQQPKDWPAFGAPWQAPPDQLNDFNQRKWAIEHPRQLLGALSSGGVSAPALDAFATVYPTVWKGLQTQMGSRVSAQMVIPNMRTRTLVMNVLQYGAPPGMVPFGSKVYTTSNPPQPAPQSGGGKAPAPGDTARTLDPMNAAIQRGADPKRW